MIYKLTVFKSIYTKSTQNVVELEDWDAFCDLFFGLSKKSGFKLKQKERYRAGAAPLVTPALFKTGKGRKNTNVECWAGWCALDIDDYECSFKDAVNVFKDIRYLCYSSASSTKEHPKFRMVIPTSEWIQADKIKHFWYALNKEFNSLGDPSTKDLARMYYIPAKYPKSYQFIFRNEGRIVDPNELMSKYDYVAPKTSFFDSLPEETKRQLLEHRKSSLTNTDIKWTSYHNCPFVNKTMVAEYRSITAKGWYHKMFQLMVSIAARSKKMGYPITADEIERLCREIDMDTGNWYSKRPMRIEAERAIMFTMT